MTSTMVPTLWSKQQIYFCSVQEMVLNRFPLKSIEENVLWLKQSLFSEYLFGCIPGMFTITMQP